MLLRYFTTFNPVHTLIRYFLGKVAKYIL